MGSPEGTLALRCGCVCKEKDVERTIIAWVAMRLRVCG